MKKKKVWHVQCIRCKSFENTESCSVRFGNVVWVHCMDCGIVKVKEKDAVYKKLVPRFLSRKEIRNLKEVELK